MKFSLCFNFFIFFLFFYQVPLPAGPFSPFIYLFILGIFNFYFTPNLRFSHLLRHPYSAFSLFLFVVFFLEVILMSTVGNSVNITSVLSPSLKCILSALIFPLFSFNLKKYFHSPSHLLFYLTFWLISFQAFIITTCFIFPPAHQLILRLAYSDSFRAILEYNYLGQRGFALSGAYSFGLSSVITLLLYICFCSLKNLVNEGIFTSSNFHFFTLMLGICLLPMISTGRTVLVVLPFLFVFLPLRSFLLFILPSLFFVACIFISFDERLLRYSSYAFSFFMNNEDSYSSANDLFSSINEIVAQFGSYRYGFITGSYSMYESNGRYFGYSDSGLIRNILFWGAILYPVLVGTFIYILNKTLVGLESTRTKFIPIILIVLSVKGLVFFNTVPLVPLLLLATSIFYVYNTSHPDIMKRT